MKKTLILLPFLALSLVGAQNVSAYAGSGPVDHRADCVSYARGTVQLTNTQAQNWCGIMVAVPYNPIAKPQQAPAPVVATSTPDTIVVVNLQTPEGILSASSTDEVATSTDAATTEALAQTASAVDAVSDEQMAAFQAQIKALLQQIANILRNR